MRSKMDYFTVWISRRLWPWPKKYKCKGVAWGLYIDSTIKGELPILLDQDIICLILIDERRVYVDKTNRIITYGRDFFEDILKNMERQVGQKIPIKE